MIDHTELLAALAGEWALNRTIAAEGASMTGTATFTPETGGSVLYREEGELRLRDGRATPAYRHYSVRAERDALLLSFVDGPDGGRHFVALRFGSNDAGLLVASDTHPCAADRYDVAWRLDLPDRFETDIIAFGPRHDYRALTHYRRA